MKKKPTKPPPKESYDAKYRKDNPLLTTHVPKRVYDEVRRLALADARSMSKWLSLYLEKNLLKGAKDA